MRVREERMQRKLRMVTARGWRVGTSTDDSLSVEMALRPSSERVLACGSEAERSASVSPSGRQDPKRLAGHTSTLTAIVRSNMAHADSSCYAREEREQNSRTRPLLWCGRR